jgi:hypothetical protein
MNEELPPPVPLEPERPPRRLDEVKSWLRELREHLKLAVEEAREASSEKRAEMRADFERKTGRRKD